MNGSLAQSTGGDEAQWLRVTLSSIGDGVIATDGDGRVSFLNPIAEALTGWQDDEASGQPLHCVFHIINEKTRQAVESPVLKVLETGRIVGLANHTVLIARDGTERAIDDSAAPIQGPDGSIRGVILVFRDVTERRRAEQSTRFLASIVESSDDAIIGKDVNGTVTSWNRAAERMFGYSAGEMIGQPIARLAPPDRADEMPTILARIRRGERVDHFETVRRARDGRLIPLSITVSPITDEDGDIIGASKIARDISERKRAEEALLEAHQRKDRFLATLAHELRNPLAPIRTSLELLKAAQGDASVIAEAQATMDRQVQQIVRLVDDLLDINRIANGKVALKKERVELADIARNAVEAIGPQVRDRQQKFTVSLPERPVYLDVDPVRIGQAVSNLLSNASKYTERAGHIWLTAGQRDGSVLISVRDDGIGIDSEQLPHVFEMFYQAAPSQARSQGGLGIGLSLVKGVIELHGGSVEARSDGPGKGSEFMICLPKDASP